MVNICEKCGYDESEHDELQCPDIEEHCEFEPRKNKGLKEEAK